MDSREFAIMVKQEVLDSVVRLTLDRLRNPVMSAWFSNLSIADQSQVKEIIQDTAELSIASFLTLIDGVGGSYEGVFEIIAVDAEGNRTVVNPENTEMLHDVFSEICKEER